ncbi:hypothetical protein [Bartonella elizabethae]|uniref:hypothetical protein n=1 Tax=Bartonella elizabethae TaxID=807 RepID=UPI001FCE24B3|nr:hypothetical protein [Bartonella elizabethae]
MVIYRQIGDSALRFVRNMTMPKDIHILDGLVPIDKLADNICKCHNRAPEEIENRRL